MVGYFNTLPFLHGLKNNSNFNLILDIPSKCMDYFESMKADIALVPIATLLDRKDYNIITDYCIGCNGVVRTVSLFSNTQIKEVNKIFLDTDSRTSQKLVKILCANLWHIEPEFIECDVRGMRPTDLKANEAVLMIGDKVFGKEEAFQFNYDLGEEWKNLTGLPFAFAVWISRQAVDPKIIDDLNQTIGLGVDNIDEVVKDNNTVASYINLSDYFKSNIDFKLDSKKKKAFELFFEYNAVELNVDVLNE